MKLIFAIMVGILAWLYMKDRRDRPNILFVNTDAVYQMSEDQKEPLNMCFKFSSCVFIYVAPWCPSCHAFLSEFSLVKDRLNRQNVGIVLVIGAEKDEAKKIELQKRYPSDSILDTPDNDFHKKNKVEYYPYYIAADSSKKVKYTGARAGKYIEDTVNAKPIN